MTVHLSEIPLPVQHALIKGDIRQANEILGYPYSLRGLVIHGDHLGKTFGFPTANVAFENEKPFLLARGVYAVFTNVSGIVYQGMANVGIRPTLNENQLKLEVNIFNFHEDIYGKELIVFFMERIRDEKKFHSVDALIEQIRQDKIQVKQLLSRLNYPDANS